MKIYYMIFLAIVIFLLQACACECKNQKSEAEKKGFAGAEKKEQQELEKTALDNNQKTELLGSMNINTSTIGLPETVKLKFPSEPPELTPEQERKREETLNQINVPIKSN